MFPSLVLCHETSSVRTKAQYIQVWPSRAGDHDPNRLWPATSGSPIAVSPGLTLSKLTGPIAQLLTPNPSPRQRVVQTALARGGLENPVANVIPRRCSSSGSQICHGRLCKWLADRSRVRQV